MDLKEWLCFIVWNTNSPPSAAICLHSSVIVPLVKQDDTFLLQLLVFAAVAFSSLDMLQYIGTTSMPY
jgi:hypothetical protein